MSEIIEPRHIINFTYQGDGDLKAMLPIYVDTFEQAVTLNKNNPQELQELKSRMNGIQAQIEWHLFANKYPELAKKPLWAETHPESKDDDWGNAWEIDYSKYNGSICGDDVLEVKR